MKAIPQAYDNWRGGLKEEQGPLEVLDLEQEEEQEWEEVQHIIILNLRGFLCRLPVQLFMCTQDRSYM